MHYTVWDPEQTTVLATFSGPNAWRNTKSWLVKKGGVEELEPMDDEEAYYAMFGGRAFVDDGDPDAYVDPPGLGRLIVEETYSGSVG